ncbi:hypothetical protein BJ742DRAFT_744118 [Cladochytrium replicatum]|nr:hypothetical protein BJ742DRAFT_744118 [Cladochytrium replicatum]
MLRQNLTAAKVSIIGQDTNQLDTLANQDHFDFNFHTYNRLSNVNIAPGDRLLMKCVWDSTNYANGTKGGLSSYEEMCFGFIDYYPLKNLTTGLRLPRILNSTLDLVNVTTPLEGNTNLCVKSS